MKTTLFTILACLFLIGFAGNAFSQDEAPATTKSKVTQTTETAPKVTRKQVMTDMSLTPEQTAQIKAINAEFAPQRKEITEARKAAKSQLEAARNAGDRNGVEQANQALASLTSRSKMLTYDINQKIASVLNKKQAKIWATYANR